MRLFYCVVGLTAAVTLFCGCSSERRAEAAAARAGDELAPDFLTGPGSLALTNVDGFSAHVSAGGMAGTAPVILGDLIGRQGRLIYQPKATARVKKGKIMRGGMFFIWDANLQNGFVLSEALQAFAPTSSARVASVTPDGHAPVSEVVDGHPCRRTESVVAMSEGPSARVTEWRADDLQHFPVRIQTEIQGHATTVDFTDVRLDLPRPELFNPPASFTKYATSRALMNELMIRESTQKKGPTGEMPDLGSPQDNSWRGATVPR